MQTKRIATVADPAPPQDLSATQICAVLRGESLRVSDADAFVELAVSEGLAPLAYQSRALPDLPPKASDVLREELRRQLALATVREAELRSVLSALARSGLDVLVIKGAHLGHSYYRDSALRPRHDTDLLIRPGQEVMAIQVLEARGYRHQPAITGTAVQGQAIFERDDISGSVLDVHWRLASPVVAANILDFEDLWGRACPIPILGPAARGPHLLDAIVIAAVHLVAHHPRERGLLWLHDLHLLIGALTVAEERELVREITERKVTAVGAAAIRRTEEYFPTHPGARILSALRIDASEPSARLLDPLNPAARTMMDVRALRGWRARTTYLAGHLFPPAEYMRRRYAPGSRAPLPWLYASRMIRGARRWVS